MSEKLPIWNAVGVEPPELLKTDGWQPGMKPSAQHMNWLFNRIYKCLEEIQTGGGTEELEQELANLQQALATHMAEKASTIAYGHTILNPTTTSTSHAEAATAGAVKLAKDEAIQFAKSFGLGSTAKSLGTVNLNDITETGFYYISSGINAPSNENGWLINQVLSTSYVQQMFFGVNSRNLKIRTKDGTWQPWTKVLDESMKNVPDGYVGIGADGVPQVSAKRTKISEINFATNPTVNATIGNLEGYRDFLFLMKKVGHNRASQESLNMLINGLNGSNSYQMAKIAGSSATVGYANSVITTGTMGVGQTFSGDSLLDNVGTFIRCQTEVAAHTAGSNLYVSSILTNVIVSDPTVTVISSITLLTNNSSLMNSGTIELWGVPR